jgi:hypothetical protein
MANEAYASVNVHECSWADLSVTINIIDAAELKVTDLEGCKWGAKVEVGESRGLSGGRRMKRTRGSVSYEGSASATRAGWMALLEGLETAAMAKGLVRGDRILIGAVEFDVLFQHTPLGDSRIYATKMTGCRLLEHGSDMKQGNDADVIELNLDPMEVATKSVTGNWLVLL